MIKVKVTKSFMSEFNAELERQVAKRKEELVDQLAAATPFDTGQARNGWEIEGDSIVNKIDYIDELNGGSSQQAPRYFVEQTLLANSDVKPSGTIVRSK